MRYLHRYTPCSNCAGHPNKLQLTWLHCSATRLLNASRTRPSITSSTPNPEESYGREFIACLRLARAKRWSRSRGENRRGQIADLLSIHVRPPELEDRQFPGHWEADLIKRAGNLSALGTLVQRSTRLLMLLKLPHPHPATAAHILQAFTDKLNGIAQSPCARP